MTILGIILAAEHLFVWAVLAIMAVALIGAAVQWMVGE
jgi:hypothetical protein